MRTLFAISIVSLVALLWASISIAQYISRARKRRQALNAYEKQFGIKLTPADDDQNFDEQPTPPPDKKTERAD